MTSEVVIMNREAVALAADSAATVSGRKHAKIYTSANKLFSLSDYYPVGIMVYGEADLAGIPWETIIKLYRKSLGNKKFKTLREYAEDFMNFLKGGNILFPESEQERYVARCVYGIFAEIRNNVVKKLQLVDKKKKGWSSDEIQKIISDSIKEANEVLIKKAKPLKTVPSGYRKNILDKYQDIIRKGKRDIFEKLPINRQISARLTKIAVDLFLKEVFPDQISNQISGVVIAGFGEKELFPSCQSYIIDGVADNVIKYKSEALIEITEKNNASLRAFAHRRMVNTFMEGVDPWYEAMMLSYLEKLFKEIPNIIVNNLGNLGKDEIEKLLKKLTNIDKKLIKEYATEAKDYKQKKNIQPILRAVAVLPKDELASMAEALVSLTIVKKRVTMEEEETVGGPIDIAVISKGDGFIWIKRKKYFELELNPRFMASHYKYTKK